MGEKLIGDDPRCRNVSIRPELLAAMSGHKQSISHSPERERERSVRDRKTSVKMPAILSSNMDLLGELLREFLWIPSL